MFNDQCTQEAVPPLFLFAQEFPDFFSCSVSPIEEEFYDAFREQAMMYHDIQIQDEFKLLNCRPMGKRYGDDETQASQNLLTSSFASIESNHSVSTLGFFCGREVIHTVQEELYCGKDSQCQQNWDFQLDGRELVHIVQDEFVHIVQDELNCGGYRYNECYQDDEDYSDAVSVTNSWMTEADSNGENQSRSNPRMRTQPSPRSTRAHKCFVKKDSLHAVNAEGPALKCAPLAARKTSKNKKKWRETKDDVVSYSTDTHRSVNKDQLPSERRLRNNVSIGNFVESNTSRKRCVQTSKKHGLEKTNQHQTRYPLCEQSSTMSTFAEGTNLLQSEGILKFGENWPSNDGSTIHSSRQFQRSEIRKNDKDCDQIVDQKLDSSTVFALSRDACLSSTPNAIKSIRNQPAMNSKGVAAMISLHTASKQANDFPQFINTSHLFLVSNLSISENASRELSDSIQFFTPTIAQDPSIICPHGSHESIGQNLTERIKPKENANGIPVEIFFQEGTDASPDDYKSRICEDSTNKLPSDSRAQLQEDLSKKTSFTKEIAETPTKRIQPLVSEGTFALQLSYSNTLPTRLNHEMTVILNRQEQLDDRVSKVFHDSKHESITVACDSHPQRWGNSSTCSDSQSTESVTSNKIAEMHTEMMQLVSQCTVAQTYSGFREGITGKIDGDDACKLPSVDSSPFNNASRVLEDSCSNENASSIDIADIGTKEILPALNDTSSLAESIGSEMKLINYEDAVGVISYAGPSRVASHISPELVLINTNEAHGTSDRSAPKEAEKTVPVEISFQKNSDEHKGERIKGEGSFSCIRDIYPTGMNEGRIKPVANGTAEYSSPYLDQNKRGLGGAGRFPDVPADDAIIGMRIGRMEASEAKSTFRQHSACRSCRTHIRHNSRSCLNHREGPDEKYGESEEDHHSRLTKTQSRSYQQSRDKNNSNLGKGFACDRTLQARQSVVNSNTYSSVGFQRISEMIPEIISLTEWPTAEQNLSTCKTKEICLAFPRSSQFKTQRSGVSRHTLRNSERAFSKRKTNKQKLSTSEAVFAAFEDSDRETIIRGSLEYASSLSTTRDDVTSSKSVDYRSSVSRQNGCKRHPAWCRHDPASYELEDYKYDPKLIHEYDDKKQTRSSNAKTEADRINRSIAERWFHPACYT